MKVESRVHIIPSFPGKPAFSSEYLQQALGNKGIIKVYVENKRDPNVTPLANKGIAIIPVDDFTARKDGEGRGQYNRRILSILRKLTQQEQQDRIETRRRASEISSTTDISANFAILLSPGWASELVANAVSNGKHDGNKIPQLEEGMIYELTLNGNSSAHLNSLRPRSNPYSI